MHSDPKISNALIRHHALAVLKSFQSSIEAERNDRSGKLTLTVKDICGTGHETAEMIFQKVKAALLAISPSSVQVRRITLDDDEDDPILGARVSSPDNASVEGLANALVAGGLFFPGSNEFRSKGPG